jgi:hypothetical protein
MVVRIAPCGTPLLNARQRRTMRRAYERAISGACACD